MTLDYSKGCVNFRDVGEWINLIAGHTIVPEGRIYRGGKLEFVNSSDDIYNPGTIVNLRKGEDPFNKLINSDYFHFPISNDYEKYETKNKEVRRWLNYIFNIFEQQIVKFPVLFHCTSGKDRTGVVVASLLKILNVKDQFIVEEYLLSDGDVKKKWIICALNGIEPIEKYFNRVDLSRVRDKIAGS